MTCRNPQIVVTAAKIADSDAKITRSSANITCIDIKITRSDAETIVNNEEMLSKIATSS